MAIVVLERLLPTLAVVPSHALDEYAGLYVPEAGSLPDDAARFVIERHQDVLVSKILNMHDHLYPCSASSFFTTHHYGQWTFERDATHRVSRLTYVEGSHRLVAHRVQQMNGATRD